MENHVPHLAPQHSFLIQVVVIGNTIHRTVIDEGASTCIMSISCWKSLDSSPLNQSPNTLEAFDGRGFHPYGILNALPIHLEGKIVNMEVKFFDVPVNYNLLLGLSWKNVMVCVVSTLFRMLLFPHQGKVFTVN